MSRDVSGVGLRRGSLKCQHCVVPSCCTYLKEPGDSAGWGKDVGGSHVAIERMS